MKFLLFFLLILIHISCINPFDKNTKLGNDDTDKYKLAIYHFKKTNFIKKDSVFIIRPINEKKEDNFVGIYVSIYNYLLLRTDFKVDEKINYIPNSFLEMNGKLFVWNEPNKPFNKETLEVLAKYNKIDSSMYKYEMGIGTLEDVPLVATHDYSKKYYYFFCKNDITKFKAIKGRRFPKEIPILICD